MLPTHIWQTSKRALASQGRNTHVLVNSEMANVFNILWFPWHVDSDSAIKLLSLDLTLIINV